MITETGGNAGSNRPGCSPGSPLQAEAAGIIREAQDFCRQYESPEKLAKYPVASLVLRLAHASKQLADELDRRCPHDPDYEHNAADGDESGYALDEDYNCFYPNRQGEDNE